jgi:hypothetical protein
MKRGGSSKEVTEQIMKLNYLVDPMKVISE